MRLAFGCPYYGGTPPRVVSAQLAAIMHASWSNVWVANVGTERTGHILACEQILKRAVENEKVEALFWTEHDCVLPTEAITRLVKVLVDHPEADIATGITFMRYKPYHPMIATYEGILTQEIADSTNRPLIVFNARSGEPAVGKEHFRFITRIDTSEAPYAIDATSLNCVLFRRSALEVMASIPHPFDTGENWSTPDFALFARLMGKTKLLVDPGLLTIHLGEQEECGFEKWVAEMEKAVARGDAEIRP